MVVAFVALGVALAGTAKRCPGKNRVRKDDIARAAVRTQHLYTNAVRTKHIRARNVTRSKISRRAINSDLVGQDALTGENIVESSLSTVPNASKVNNRSVEKISFVAVAGTGTDAGAEPQRPRRVCRVQRGPGADVTAGTTVSRRLDPRRRHARWRRATTTWPTTRSTPATRSTCCRTASPAAPDVRGTLTYARPDGEVVTADYLAQETATGCVFAGTAIG